MLGSNGDKWGFMIFDDEPLQGGAAPVLGRHSPGGNQVILSEMK